VNAECITVSPKSHLVIPPYIGATDGSGAPQIAYKSSLCAELRNFPPETVASFFAKRGATEAALLQHDFDSHCELQQHSAGAVVTCSHRSLEALKSTRAHGVRLPKGWSGQQGEALAGWMFLKLARLSRRRVVWMITDSEAVCALIQAVHLNPLKANFRHLAPWVPLYHEVLSGWAADLHICRQTSHSLSQQIQESDRAAAHKWEIVKMWKRSALRVELQQLGAPFSHRHKEVVRRAVQQVLTLQYADAKGPSTQCC
jgi:hypothetical protein